MKPKHINTGTFVGRVEDMSSLQKDPLGRPFLQFVLDCRPGIEVAEALNVSEKHRCVAYDALAEEVSKTVTDGATLLVEGPLFVNSRVAKHLHRRIATIPVREATLLEPSRSLSAPAGDECPQGRNRFDRYRPAQNEVHLVGKLVSVVPDDRVAPRLTISTRLPFPATHDVLVWTTRFDAHAAPLGSFVEVNGLLCHHVTPWPDGQVRLLSIVESDEVELVGNPPRAGTPSAGVPSPGSDCPVLRLN